MTFSDDTDIIERFKMFYRNEYREEIDALGQQGPDEQQSLSLDWTDLDRYDPELAAKLVANPEQVLECAEAALRTFDPSGGDRFNDASVQVPTIESPMSPSTFRSKHLGTLVEITGMVSDVSSIKSILSEGAWECDRCGTLTRVTSPSRKNEATPPHECSGCAEQGPFTLDHAQSTWTDRYTFVVEQQSSDQPSETIVIKVSGDVTEPVRTGLGVRVTGILRREPLGETNESSIPDKYVEAHAVSSGATARITLSRADRERIIELSNASDIYEQVVDSVAPSVYGHREAKRAIALQLFSGVSKHLPDESGVRGAIHTLLVGDPATAKSALGAAAQRLAPHGHSVQGGRDETFLSGVEEDETAHDKNRLLFVDDTGDLSDESKRVLTSVLETGTAVGTQFGSPTTVPVHMSILCTASPSSGRFDHYEPIGGQIDLDSALLSQFDLIFTIADSPEETTDRELADHVLATNVTGEHHAHWNRNTSPDGQMEERQREEDDAVEEVAPPIDPDLLRKYITFARHDCSPTMTEEAKESIREFYLGLRKRGRYEDTPVPVTARKIDALVRLAEASARLRLSETVTTADTDRVIEIVRSSLRDVGVDPETGQFDVDIVEVGASKTQRDRCKNVKAIISEIAVEYENGAPIEKVAERAAQVGIDNQAVDQAIQTLKDEGEIYEPFTDHLRLI